MILNISLQKQIIKHTNQLQKFTNIKAISSLKMAEIKCEILLQ